MAETEFAHLHAHSTFSFMDGLATPEALASVATEAGYNSMALTDHGNLYGAPRFAKGCELANVKPIFGCEFYMTPAIGQRDHRTESKTRRHLTVLAGNQQGWKNLVALSTISFREGFYWKPRIDEKTLFDHAEGLFVLSGCHGSHLSKLCEAGAGAQAEQTVAKYRETFGDRYFLEVVAIDLGRKPEKRIQATCGVVNLSKRLQVPLAVTGDVHYLRPEDVELQYYLALMSDHKKKEESPEDDDPKVPKKEPFVRERQPELWLKPADEIWQTFVRHWKGRGLDKEPILEGMRNSAQIASRIEFVDIDPQQDISQIPADIDAECNAPMQDSAPVLPKSMTKEVLALIRAKGVRGMTTPEIMEATNKKKESIRPLPSILAASKLVEKMTYERIGMVPGKTKAGDFHVYVAVEYAEEAKNEQR